MGSRERIKNLFQRAVELPPAQRAGYLDSHCPPEHRPELDRMIRRLESDPEFLESPTEPGSGQTRGADRAPGAGQLLEPGVTLGHYRIEEVLGRGGMGVVYRAVDLQLDRAVALKLLPSDLAFDSRREEMFEREARTAAQLNHPNVATVYEYGEADQSRFLAMELVDGVLLREYLDQHADLPRVPLVVDLAVQMAEGLAVAHAAGIIHRDLKPLNVMVGPEGRAKILDFGLARFLGPASAADGRSSAELCGTVGYLPPERMAGSSGDFAGDVFSFGVMLHELVTGDRAAAILNSVLEDEALRVESLPAGLGRVIHRCLQKQPGDRYPDATALLEDLRDVQATLQGRRSLARSVVPLVIAAAIFGVTAFSLFLSNESQKKQTRVAELQSGVLEELQQRDLLGAQARLEKLSALAGPTSDVATELAERVEEALEQERAYRRAQLESALEWGGNVDQALEDLLEIAPDSERDLVEAFCRNAILARERVRDDQIRALTTILRGRIPWRIREALEGWEAATLTGELPDQKAREQVESIRNALEVLIEGWRTEEPGELGLERGGGEVLRVGESVDSIREVEGLWAWLSPPGRIAEILECRVAEAHRRARQDLDRKKLADIQRTLELPGLDRPRLQSLRDELRNLDASLERWNMVQDSIESRLAHYEIPEVLEQAKSHFRYQLREPLAQLIERSPDHPRRGDMSEALVWLSAWEGLDREATQVRTSTGAERVRHELQSLEAEIGRLAEEFRAPARESLASCRSRLAETARAVLRREARARATELENEIERRLDGYELEAVRLQLEEFEERREADAVFREESRDHWGRIQRHRGRIERSRLEAAALEADYARLRQSIRREGPIDLEKLEERLDRRIRELRVAMNLNPDLIEECVRLELRRGSVHPDDRARLQLRRSRSPEAAWLLTLQELVDPSVGDPTDFLERLGASQDAPRERRAASHYLLGVLEDRAGRPGPARLAYEEAQQLGLRSSHLVWRLGELVLPVDPGRARQLADRAVADPITELEILVARGGYPRAIRERHHWLADADLLEANAARGVDPPDFDRVVRAATRAIEKESRSATAPRGDAYLLRGFGRLARGELPEALSDLKIASKRCHRESRGWAHVFRAQVHRRLGADNQARAALTEAETYARQIREEDAAFVQEARKLRRRWSNED